MSKGEDKFSSILKLTEFDYIIPSQICIKPVEVEKSDVNSNSKISIESDGKYVEIHEDGTKKSLEKATITLNDCLACSGCITSAESVLITAQSISEFLSNINDVNDNTSSGPTKPPKKTIVITLSPQSRASLAAHFKISTLSVVLKLKTFFKSLSIDYLFDSSFSRDFSLLESASEFVARYKKQYTYKEKDGKGVVTSAEQYPLPMLSSACPGWICYAEKTHGDFILPYISTTKSPQQIMGTLVKYYYAERIMKPPQDPSNIYHVTIMPCYDKKLEASRNDFYSDIFKTKDVDCVLSTTEILDLFKEKNVNFLDLPESSIDSIENEFYQLNGDNNQFYSLNGSSGGYLEFIFKYSAKHLFNVDVTEPLQYKVGRNQDFKEVSLEVDGKKVLNFAQAYGFRNIQNIVRKIKTNIASGGKVSGGLYDFVEVMACPSGCINGGGQIKVEGIKENKVILQESEEKYNENVSLRSPTDNKSVEKIYNNWLNGYFSSDSKSNLHTQYHRIEKITNALNIKW